MKKLKIGDTVKVILGKDKGKIGTIKTISYKKNNCNRMHAAFSI